MENMKKYLGLGIILIIAIVILQSAISGKKASDGTVVAMTAEFTGKAAPGQKLARSMFTVTGTTRTGSQVRITDFDSDTTTAPLNGQFCEVTLSYQGLTAPATVTVTREEAASFNIGYDSSESAKVTIYTNGDMEFTGSGGITNFGTAFPWNGYEYSHVYIDENLEVTTMDGWFSGNNKLVYCSALPKTLKTMTRAFYNCTALTEAPDYFQCQSLKIMDYAFAGCTSLTQIDTLPVSVSSAKYTFSNCRMLETPPDLSKTSNLADISGICSGCTLLRSVPDIPETVAVMDSSFSGCLNIKEAKKFPNAIQNARNTYSGCSALATGAAIPESATDISSCYNGCASLCGALEVNSDTDKYSGFLRGATTNGDKLSISGNSGNLLAIQKDSGNSNISLADPESAAQQNERMQREKEAGK